MRVGIKSFILFGIFLVSMLPSFAAFKSIDKKYIHYSEKRFLNGRPAIVNVLKVFPQGPNIIIKPSYGSYHLNRLIKVKDIAQKENAVAAINASFFKPDTGSPLGLSIIDGEVLTGPLYDRVVFGITDYNDFLIDKVKIKGTIYIGNNLRLRLVNINQPIMSKTGYTIYTDRWGSKTPKTSEYFVHIVVKNNKMYQIKQSSVDIPKDGFVIVGPHSIILKSITKAQLINYNINLYPEYWDTVRFAICGGPYLIKNGKIFIDRQGFNNRFLWNKAPRTAIGYTKEGSLVLVTVDGRKRGISEGATLSELASLMFELSAVEAINLDGGTSTQMVVNNTLVNYPTTKGGSRVTNALLIIIP